MGLCGSIAFGGLTAYGWHQAETCREYQALVLSAVSEGRNGGPRYWNHLEGLAPYGWCHWGDEDAASELDRGDYLAACGQGSRLSHVQHVQHDHRWICVYGPAAAAVKLDELLPDLAGGPVLICQSIVTRRTNGSRVCGGLNK